MIIFVIQQGPGSVWCDVDVVEFSYFGAPERASKEQLYTEIVDDLRGSGSCINSGSQVLIIRFYAIFSPLLVGYDLKPHHPLLLMSIIDQEKKKVKRFN